MHWGLFITIINDLLCLSSWFHIASFLGPKPKIRILQTPKIRILWKPNIRIPSKNTKKLLQQKKGFPGWQTFFEKIRKEETYSGAT
jgi:hypothetical protein